MSQVLIIELKHLSSLVAICLVGTRHPRSVLAIFMTKKFLVVGIDYFTKWVKAEPLATISKQKVRNFLWKNIMC